MESSCRSFQIEQELKDTWEETKEQNLLHFYILSPTVYSCVAHTIVFF